MRSTSVSWQAGLCPVWSLQLQREHPACSGAPGEHGNGSRVADFEAHAGPRAGAYPASAYAGRHDA